MHTLRPGLVPVEYPLCSDFSHSGGCHEGSFAGNKRAFKRFIYFPSVFCTSSRRRERATVTKLGKELISSAQRPD